MDLTIYLLAGAVVAWATFRIVLGRLRYPALLAQLEAEDILRSEAWVFTRFRFPLIKRVTFTRVILTRRRFVVLHWCSRNKVLQAPPGPRGAAGSDLHGFEVEQAGARKRLVLRTTIRGGGRVRFHLSDPDAWLEAIKQA